MNIDVFDLENFNIVSDDENYYFFRALNMGDNHDIDSHITTDEKGIIQRIRTDRERYDKTPKYDENSSLSLEEIFDHVKMHHRYDTNCISLSSNANVIAMYGRGLYKDKYVMVKVPKEDLGKNVVNAGTYMMEEIQKRIDSFLQNDNIDSLTHYFITAIENAKSQKDLDRIMDEFKRTLNEFPSVDMFERGITFSYTKTNSLDYPALNEKQNLEKNKMIAKIDIIGNDIIPNVSNKFLIETLGNAFSSLELTHYGDINGEIITEVPKEIMDIFGLLQQIPKDYPNVEELKQEVLQFLNGNRENLTSFKYANFSLDAENDYSIEKMFKLTNGNVDFDSAFDLYNKSFYLAKSKLRASSMINLLNQITGNNPKYSETLNYLYDNSYGVEPEIFSRIASKKINVSESVAIDFSPREKELFDYIDGLSNQDLEYIVNNPLNALNYYLNNFESIEKLNYDKETYYANAIFDLFDWSKLKISSISLKQRNEVIDKLKEYDVVKLYGSLKTKGVKEKDIANVLLTTIIKEKDLSNIDLNDTFTLEELEDFLGYWQVKGTKKLKLRSYQASALQNIDESFKNHRFTSAILPTGAGKSFVALAEMLEHSDKEILYLAPNNEILNQIKDYIVENIHGLPRTYGVEQDELIKRVFPNLKLRTYNATTNFNQQEVIDHRYDLIIFDELHRSGAPDWKKHILMLLGNQDNNTRVLGTTATPQRDVDLKNMADEWARYFGYSNEEIARHEHLSINMDLLEAIELGYVVNPKIVECEYNLQGEGGLDNLLEKINQIEDEETHKRLLLKFEQLRRNVEQAEGMSEVIGNNLKMGGKYIVFCPVSNQYSNQIEDEDGNIIDSKITGEDVIEKYKQELLNQLKQYYGLDDEQINKIVDFNSMLADYSKSKNRIELQNFEQDDFSKIKFMVVMDKLNEGVHVKDIDGIIWYRPLDENSKILFLQQLGRIIYSKDPNKELPEDKIPVAIDLVNNVLRVNMDKGEKFHSSDLDKLINILNWSREHEGSIPDLNSFDRVEQSYGLSLKRIQEKYRGYLENSETIDLYDMSEQEEIKQILNLGKTIDLWGYDFPEHIKQEKEKKSEISDIEDIFEIKGILKDFYDLSSEVDELNDDFYKYIKLLAAYKEENNDGMVPVRFRTLDGIHQITDKKDPNYEAAVELGNWISTQRQNYKNGLLSKEKIQILEENGMVWNMFEYRNEQSFILFRNYFKKYGNGIVPKGFITIDGINKIPDDSSEKVKNKAIDLGQWVYHKREAYKAGKLAEEEIRQLEENGMIWSKPEYQNQLFLILFKNYVQEYGKSTVPRGFRTIDGVTKITDEKDPNYDNSVDLGELVNRRRRLYKSGDLSKEQIKQLEEVGMVFEPKKNKEIITNICIQYEIDIKKNKSIFNKSAKEVQSKINYLEEQGIPLSQGDELNSIFFMSDIDMQEQFGVSLKELIDTYAIDRESTKGAR